MYTLNKQRACLTSGVLGMWSCTIKLDEKIPTYAGLAHGNGFSPHIIGHVDVAGKKHISGVQLQKRV